MTDLFVLANQVSAPIKVAWLFWLSWVVIQGASYRWARVTAPAVDEPMPLPALEQHAVEDMRDSSSNPRSQISNPKSESGLTAARRRRRRRMPLSSTPQEASESIARGVEETISMAGGSASDGEALGEYVR